VSKFLRAASHGVVLNESWIVVSAAAYVWNYSNHLMSQQRQHEIVASLQVVLDAVKAVEIPRYAMLASSGLTLLFCIAVLFVNFGKFADVMNYDYYYYY